MKLAPGEQIKITHAMNEIMRQTKWDKIAKQTVITFRPKNENDANYIRFVRADTQDLCESGIGRKATAGPQVSKLCKSKP